MTEVIIKHNPYLVETQITIDGNAPVENSKFNTHKNEHFQLWVEEIPDILVSQNKDDYYNIKFHGTMLDYIDLYEALDAYQDANFKLTHIEAKSFDEKENELKALFQEMQKLPFENLKTVDLKNKFNTALEAKLEVNVVATMSAGKSTLINTLLGRELMPSENAACTALITKIKDNASDTFTAIAYHKDTKDIIKEIDNLTYADMSELNANSEIGEIHVEGNIPFVNSNEISLVLIDTPGVDNARDIKHRETTENALKASSKDLVLFVMDGTRAHTDAENQFLNTIADSMSVNGKQSKERFLFTLSKLDQYDTDKDNIPEKTIPSALKYLETKGVKNPYLFLTAAKPALNARRILNGEEFAPKKSIKIKNACEEFIVEEQLHLEQYVCSNPVVAEDDAENVAIQNFLSTQNYVRLSRNCEKTILSEIEVSQKEDDIYKQTIAHSGIRGLEETMKNYVNKYARPTKIRNIVSTFDKEIETVLANAQAINLVAASENLEKAQKEIEKLIHYREENAKQESFRNRIQALEIDSNFKSNLSSTLAKVNMQLNNFFINSPEKFDKEYAIEKLKEFDELVTQQYAKLSVDVNDLLEIDIKEKSEKILAEYLKVLEGMSNQFEIDSDLKIDFASLVAGKLHSLGNGAVNSNDAEMIDEAMETETVRKTRTEKRTENRRKRGWERFKSIKAWFNPNYKVQVSYEIDYDEEEEFISRETLSNKKLAPIRVSLNKFQNELIEQVTGETRSIKEYFFAQFEIVEAELSIRINELDLATKNQNNAQQALKKARAEIAMINSIKLNLSKILDI